MKRRAFSATITIGLIFGSIVSVAASACSDSQTHVYYGQGYDPVRDCLDSVVVVDIISGTDTGQSCPLVCIATSQNQDAAVSVYVSTTCPPYPPLFDTSGTNPQCPLALAAANRKATCLDDGGVTGSPIDSGEANDASTD